MKTGSGGPARTEDLPLTQVQRDLIAQIKSYSERASDIYRGVLHVVYGGMHPGRLSALAYVLRDTIDALARAGRGNGEGGRAPSADERRRMLADQLGSKTGQKRAPGIEYRALVNFHGLLDNVARDSTNETDVVITSVVFQTEGILHALTASRTRPDKKIKEIMSKPPTLDGARELVYMILNGNKRYQIVDGLDPAWLGCMTEAGLFKDPGRGYWVPHRFLYRCTEKHPESVAEVITSYGAKEVGSNRLLYMDMLEFALRLGMPHAETVARFMLEGDLCRRFRYDPEAYFGVIAKMYKVGRHELAADLLRGALSTLENPGACGDHGSERMHLERTVRECMGGEMLPMVSAMADLLDGYIEAGRSDPSMSGERPFIADTGENYPDSIKTAMITNIRDCLYYVGVDEACMRRVMENVSRRANQVWRRMEMHAYSRFPHLERMEELATMYMWKEGVRHEYMEMLGGMESASDGTKRRIQEAIMLGPGREGMERLNAEHGNRAGAVLDLRRLRLLEAARAWLDMEHLGAYHELSDRYRRPRRERPAQDPPMLAGTDEYKMINIIISYDQNPTYGVLDEFSDFVRENPRRASALAGRIKGADPEIHARFFGEMEKELNGGGRVDWDGVMELLCYVVSGFSETNDRTHRPAVAACHMLRAFMRRRKGPGPREQILESVAGLAAKSSGTGRRFEPASSEFSESLNSVDGLTFHIMVLYMLWDGGDGTARKAREHIDAYLGKHGSHTPSRNAVLGAYMPSLSNVDAGWTAEMMKAAFNGPCGDGFWNGYVLKNRPYTDIFEDISDKYDGFLNGRGDLVESSMHVATFYHVLTAYMDGVGVADDILKRFLGSVDPEMVDRYVEEVDVAVKSWGRDDTDWSRMEMLWTSDAFRKRDLSGWFVGCNMDRKTAIRLYSEYVKRRAGAGIRLTGDLAGELEEYAEEFPSEVAGIVGLLLRNAADGQALPGMRGILDALERTKGVAAVAARTGRGAGGTGRRQA